MNAAVQITIDLASATPSYRQIVDQVRVLIAERSLPAGAMLPPVRTLARELAVHHNTVAEAYRTLAAEGLLEIVHGRGAVVAGSVRPASADERKESVLTLRRRLREVVAEYRTRGLSPQQIARELRGLTEDLSV